MALKLECTENTVSAYLDGELDHHSTRSIREEIDEAIERVKPNQLIIDFRNVTFMDSSGIGLVMGRYREMQRLNGSVRITNTSIHIRKVMRLAGIDRLATIE